MPTSRPARSPTTAGVALAVTLVGALASPSAAQAHGIGGAGSSLPIPAWLFAWAAALVLLVSFVALGTLWPSPRLSPDPVHRIGAIPSWLDVAAGALGAAVFAIVVCAGLFGEQSATENLAPTFVFVAFWVGMPLISAIFGDVFHALNPWRAIARAVAALTRSIAPASATAEPLRYPARLGFWPAVVGLLAFGWLELVYVDRDQPRTLAVLALVYAGVQLFGMSLYGIETWTRRADAFSVYFSLMARFSPLHAKRRVLYLRPPLSGLTTLEVIPGTVALLCVLLGTTTFDGLSAGVLWADASRPLQQAFHHLGLSLEDALELAFTAGLLACVLIVSGFYRIGIVGMSSIAPDREPSRALAGRFAHTLAPVALGYVLAHYFSLLIFGGQSLAYQASDPLANGANLLGTATWQVNYTLLTTTEIWCAEVAFLVAGHVGGLVLAHERALVEYPDRRLAVRSQYWALTVMVGFTSLGLWLLSSANV